MKCCVLSCKNYGSKRQCFERYHISRLDGSTHACNIEQCGGGVGRNMAEALWRLRGGRARLLTAVGDDADGRYLESIAPGLLLDGCIVKDGRTPSYAAVLDSRGECLLGLGDMGLHKHITPDLVNKHMKVLEMSPLVVIDGNLPQATMDHVLQVCDQLRKPVFYEPTDRRKATKVLHKKLVIAYASPNLAELREIARFHAPGHTTDQTSDGDLLEILRLSILASQYIKFLVITMGGKGVVTITNMEYEKTNEQNKDKLKIKLYPTDPMDNIENVSGAGDSFSSGVIHGLLSGFKESQCIAVGFKAARMTLSSKNTVSPNLSSLNTSMTENICFKYLDELK